MLVTPLPIITEVRHSQLRKAARPMVVTLLGITTESRLLHPSKANPPIVVTLLGISTEIRLEQYSFLQSVVYQANACIKVEKLGGWFWSGMEGE